MQDQKRKKKQTKKSRKQKKMGELEITTLNETNEQLKQQLAEQTQRADEEKQALKVAQEKLKEQLEEQIHEEISLRAGMKKLEQTNKTQKTTIAQLTQEFANLDAKHQALAEEKQQMQAQLRGEESLMQQVQAAKTELAEHKLQIIALLDSQKEPLEAIQKENEAQQQLIEQQEKALVSVRAERDHFKGRYNQIMKTKIMKWTGKYWLIRKKLRSNNK
ncbi:hypothetical protein HB904_12580 [Listeria booriae]|uniref:Uncharacterized protein n=1 Tax=Listeria booriae TaxID=1552123 RepID=A0A841YN61_9LIST|nr:hypothetical protein [Listeria booriae]MBC1401881.1 hypothetical protein [Listeria booriae]MBC1617032.1 hypothetical protein [Listeria booriae]